MSERDWEKLTKVNTQLRLKKNKVKFTPYGTANILPVMGRAKVVMQNQLRRAEEDHGLHCERADRVWGRMMRRLWVYYG